jgi:transposase InsO family protein
MAGVSGSGYYKWLPMTDKPDRDHDDYLKIKAVFDKGKGKYGWRNIKMRLPWMNHKKIQRIMKKYDLVVKVRRRNPYRMIMKKRLEHRVFPNLLQRQFRQIFPYKAFCTDITYLPFQNEFAYLSVVKDVASGEVVGWNASRRLDIDLVTTTIENMHGPVSFKDTLLHSDQGFHYTNPTYIKTLKELGVNQSMSGKGNCIDNAPIESFFGHLKDELDYKNCKTFEELYLKIKDYMLYYNLERKQWSRNKMSPIQYRNHLLIQAKT